MNKKIVIGVLVAAILVTVTLTLVLYLNRSNFDVDVSDSTSPDGLVCEEKQFDLLLLVDGSRSPVTYGIDDDLFSAVDAFIDSLDLSSSRLSIMDKRGWGNYNNTGFTTDTELLKAQYKTFGFVGDPVCSLFKDSIGGVGCPTEEEKITNRIRSFLDTNSREVNGEIVPTVIITFDDGDRAQLPQLDQDFNSCNPIASDLADWQSLEEYGDMYWIRFENENSNSCEFWQEPNVMTRGRGSLLDYDYANGNEVQNLIDQLENIFEDQCRLVLEVEKSNQIAQTDNNSAIVDYTVNLTNPNSYAIENVNLEDTLPNSANSVSNINPSNGIFTDSTNTIQWSVPIIQANESITYTYSVEYLEEDFGELVNEVCVYVDTNRNGMFDINEVDSCDESTVLLTVAGIIDPVQISKTGQVLSEIENPIGDFDAYTNYSIVVTNPNDFVVNNVYVLDYLPELVNNVQNIQPANGVYDPQTNQIQWVLETIAPGAQVQISYSVGYTRENFGRMENLVEVYIDLNNDGTLDSNELNDEDDEVLNIPADFGLIPLGIIKNSVTDSISNENAIVTYTIQVNNPNDLTLENIIVEDSLPNSSQQVQNIGQNGVLNSNENKLVWNIPSINANSTVELTFQATYPSSSFGIDITNTSAVYLDINQDRIPQTSELNATDSETNNFDPNSSAVIDKNAVLNFDSNPNGTIAQYTLTITNTGDSQLINLVIEDTIDSKIPESYFLDLGNGNFDNGVVTWNVPSIAVGESVELQYSILVPNDVAGEFRNNVNLLDSNQNILDSDLEIFNIIIEINDSDDDPDNPGPTPVDPTENGNNGQNPNGNPTTPSQTGNETLPDTSVLTEAPVLVLLFGAMFITIGTLLRLLDIRKYMRRLFRQEDPFIEEVYDDIEL